MRKISKKIFASVLALAMTVAGSVVTFAEDEIVVPAPSSQEVIDNGDGTVTVKFSVEGMKMGYDYGVAYDSSKASVILNEEDEAATFSDEFSKWLTKGSGLPFSEDQKDKGYVAIGGVCAKDKGEFSGLVATVNFKVSDSKAKFAVIDNVGPLKLADSDNLYTKVENGDVEAPAGLVTAEPDNNNNNNTDPTDPPTSGDPTTTTPAGDATTAPATTTAPAGNGPADGAKTTAPAAAATTAAGAVKTAKPTGDATTTAGVVLPIVAICGAAAAVVVASKKRVED